MKFKILRIVAVLAAAIGGIFGRPPWSSPASSTGTNGSVGVAYIDPVVTTFMVLRGKTRFLMSKTKIKGKRGKAKEYERFLIHIPSRIAADSQFPFEAGQELTITVDPEGKIVLSG